MRAKEIEKTATRPVNLRVRDDVRSIIDRAASVRGKNRSEFMIEASLAAATDTLLDQTFITVDAETYAQFLKVLDGPPKSEGYKRLMSVPLPWAPK